MAAMALKGIRVVDFTWVVAGPVATRMLADNGAEVIKVERKIPGYMGPRKVGLQPDLNRNKLSVAINMAEPRGVELARELVRISDLVIDNFSARVMRGWGMDYESLRKIKPDIICISMSGLGHTGPRRDYVSYGPTLQSLTGFTRLMTDPNGEPAGYGYSFSDLAGGLAGGFVALSALWHRRRTGQGQFIDLSQMEALTGYLGPGLLDISVNGREQSPVDWRAQEKPAAPYGVYRCQPSDGDDDRWIVISVGSQAEWNRFKNAIGAPPWVDDTKFHTLYLRMRNREELDRQVASWTANHQAEAAMTILQRAGVPAGLVENGVDLCTRDPQLQFRNFWAAVKRPDGSDTYVSGIPYRLSATPGAIRSNAPEVGENNEYVLGELLGLSPAEREELYAHQVVWH
ncbi:MAG TPA: CoA transferase [Candidatus Binataceae bacterium]|nr:CoA transferase [Candidatus Binataceae bacterium]